MAPIYAEKPANDFAILEPGTFTARCYSMIEIGSYDYEYNGKVTHPHKVRISWEIPSETVVFDEAKGPQPFVISKDYNLSMHKKSTLRIELESWRGKPFTEAEAEKFDVTALIGKVCMINVIHKPKASDPSQKVAVINNISQLHKDLTCLPPVNKPVVLSYADFDWDIYATLPDFIKDRMKESDEFKKLTAGESSQQGNVDPETGKSIPNENSF